MPPSSPDSASQVRALAYAMFDGAIDAKGVEQLEGLILNDPACLQTYLEVVNLHSDLLSKADLKTDREAALAVLRDFTLACDRRETRRRRNEILLMVASVSLVGGLLGWMFFAEAFRPTPLGSIAHMTSNASLRSEKMELGQVLRRGKTLSVTEGIISFQLENVLIDLVGPAELKLESSTLVQLQQGKLTAHVLPGGEGFTVRTPDAEVVDQGTEFYVAYDSARGTDVAVRRGRAKASLLNSQGSPDMVVELATSRSARFHLPEALLEETIYQPQVFEKVDRARGTVRSMSGQLRTMPDPPLSLVSEQTETPNFLLVVRERQNVKLEQDLVMDGASGRTTIPAGTRVSSYLVHYDPTVKATYAPRGTITFFGRIGAAIIDASALNASDAIFGLPETVYESRASRGLERNADEIRVSDDRQAVSFFFGMAPPEYLDEVRILVVAD